MYAIILFRSLTYAQRGSRALSLAGIPSYVMKAPQGLTEKGCGYGVRLNEAKLRRAVALLDERSIDRGRAVLLSRLTGEYREVPLCSLGTARRPRSRSRREFRAPWGAPCRASRAPAAATTPPPCEPRKRFLPAGRKRRYSFT